MNFGHVKWIVNSPYVMLCFIYRHSQIVTLNKNLKIPNIGQCPLFTKNSEYCKLKIKESI